MTLLECESFFCKARIGLGPANERGAVKRAQHRTLAYLFSDVDCHIWSVVDSRGVVGLRGSEDWPVIASRKPVGEVRQGDGIFLSGTDGGQLIEVNVSRDGNSGTTKVGGAVRCNGHIHAEHVSSIFAMVKSASM